MRCNWLVIGALVGALTVVFGAFGAHALRERLSPDQAELWRTAVQYQGLHALALALAGLLSQRSGRGSAAAWAFLAGTLLFSGSLYGLALGAPKSIGAITPVGGLSFIVGWSLLAWAARSEGRAGPEVWES